MELAHFHRLRTAVQCNARPSSSADLTEAQFRVWDGLLSTGFGDVEVGATDDMDNLVIAMCTFPGHLTEDLVARRLAALWEDRLRHPFWGPHTTLVDRDQVELEGATRAGTQDPFLTVHIVAQRTEDRGAQAGRSSAIPAQRSGS